ncbi:MAG: polysaccharide deacetylase family protein [Sarcina sp.]
MNNRRKKIMRNRIIAIVIAAVIVGGGYYGIRKLIHSNTTVKAKVATQTKTTTNTEKTASSNKNNGSADASTITPAQMKEMETGHWASNKNLGYINPIYKGYNPNLIVPGENLIKSAQSYAVPANEVAQIINGKDIGNEKEVFLTFDDGPSPNNTPQILQILKENNVHATFFVVGTFLKSYPALQKVVREELMDGNAIGDHTFNHDYSELYPGNSVNVPEYMKQHNETVELLQDLLGPTFDTRILRMPGGYMSRKYYNDKNIVEFNKTLDKEHLTALDWNAETGDAETAGQLDINKLLATMKQQIGDQKQVVVLMHDAGAKVDTVKALPAVINYFKQNGYQFKVIENAPISSFNNLPDVTDGNSNQLPAQTKTN